MNKELSAKQISGAQRAVTSDHSNICECYGGNLQKSSCNAKVIFWILLVCIIGVTAGCSSGKVEQREIIQASVESTGINGQWTGAVDDPEGNIIEFRYRFRAEGSALIGLFETDGGTAQITEGKIEGNNIEFTLNMGTFTIINNGVLSGDEIHLTETINGGKIELILNRVKYDD